MSDPVPDWLDVARAELKGQGLAGWLIHDFRGSNPFADRFLGTGAMNLSRPIFALVPAEGEPVALVSVLEAGSLRMPGFEVRSYAGRRSADEELARLVPDGPVAMEYAPNADLPYVSVVDAGTIERLRGLGAEIVSSAELLQAFAAWNEERIFQHRQAARSVMEVLDDAWNLISEETAAGREVRETDVQDRIAEGFEQRGLTYAHRAIVGFGPHGGDPHYAPRRGEDRALQPNDPILIDLFARLPQEGAPYADVTWMGVYGAPEPAFARAFERVVAARRAAVAFLRQAASERRAVEGREVDRVVRDLLADAGYEDAFVHRTGHSLGSRHTHGEAVHFDDFETRDGRLLRPGIGMTIEPGVYLPEFGVRSELNLVMHEDGPEITTGEQSELVRIPLGPHHAQR